MIPNIQNVQNRQIHRDRKYISVCIGLRQNGEIEWGLTANGYRFSFRSDEIAQN